jgi:Diacylglycerol kinase catalytic domain
LTKLAVITNRASTRNRHGDTWVDSLLKTESDVVHFKVDHADQIAGTVQRCADVSATAIVINGGDGTAGLVFAALLNGTAYSRLPALALLPSGKTNMTTAGWRLMDTPEAGLTAVLKSRRDATLAGHVVSRPVLALRQNAGTPPLYGAFFGAAEVVEGIRFCRSHIYPLNLPNPISHSAALTVLLWRGLRAKANGTAAVLQNEQVLESGNFFMIAATALDEVLLGIKPEPAEVSQDDRADSGLYYVSLRIGAGPILGMLPGLMRGHVRPGSGRTVRRFDRLTLNFTGAYTLDGEIYEARAGEPLMLDGSQRLNFIRIPL